MNDATTKAGSGVDGLDHILNGGFRRGRVYLIEGSPGTCKTTMRSPEGEDFPNVGVYLEIVPNERLVFTDAYGEGWEPNPNLFFTAILTFETLANGKTRYTARAVH